MTAAVLLNSEEKQYLKESFVTSGASCHAPQTALPSQDEEAWIQAVLIDHPDLVDRLLRDNAFEEALMAGVDRKMGLATSQNPEPAPSLS